MMKIEALTEAHIKTVVYKHVGVGPKADCETCRLILTWAVAQAERERLEFYSRRRFDHSSVNYYEDWLNAVLDRVGWPKEGK